MFGKKRVQLDEYCEGMLKYVFSLHYDEVADRLLDACPPAYREGIDRDWYLKNLRAAVLQLLGIAFSRNLKRDQRGDAMLFVRSFLKAGAHEDVESLYEQYNSAFGSDFEDGVRAMAALFARTCAAPNVDPGEVQGLHYDAFYEVLRDFFENIKSVKVV